ncbi:hypothetical protein AB5I41_07805 [Sphingomonas sp. MMS24-JH45]
MAATRRPSRFPTSWARATPLPARAGRSASMRLWRRQCGRTDDHRHRIQRPHHRLFGEPLGQDSDFSGGAGDDILNGGLGDDKLDGGEGTDTASTMASRRSIASLAAGPLPTRAAPTR